MGPEQPYYHLSNNREQLAILLITVISQDVAGYFKQIEGGPRMTLNMHDHSAVNLSQFQNLKSQIGAQGA